MPMRTGDLELSLTSLGDLDAAKALILMAYEGRGSAPDIAPTVAKDFVTR